MKLERDGLGGYLKEMDIMGPFGLNLLLLKLKTENTVVK